MKLRTSAALGRITHGLSPPHVRASFAHALFHKVVRLALILASTSAIREQLLTSAGVEYRAQKPNVDEAGIKAQLTDASQIANELAAAKACSLEGDDWVIGSDSVVGIDGRVFD